jgi:beta-lactamase class D
LSTDFEEFEKKLFETISHAYDLINVRQTKPLQPQNMNHKMGIKMTFHSYVCHRLKLLRSMARSINDCRFTTNLNSMVYQNANLTNIQKLYYLKNYFKIRAEQIIYLLELTNRNYSIAL